MTRNTTIFQLFIAIVVFTASLCGNVKADNVRMRIAEWGTFTVLQNNNSMTDDGSLSVLAGRLKIPYVNVEAQHGHLEMQVEMLFELAKIVSEEDQ